MKATQERVRAYEASRRTAGLTGRLLGLDLPARDVLHGEQLRAFDEAVAIARVVAGREGRAVAVEGSGISLTDGHDTWLVHPDGALTRSLELFPGFEHLLRLAGEAPAPAAPGEVALERVLELLYLAFWAPSATNWQPTRVLLSRSGPLHEALGQAAGRADAACLRALLLRRDRYESLLGDVLEPFGLAVTAREESIDAGIFAHTLRLGGTSLGVGVHEHVLDEAQVDTLRATLLADLGARRAAEGLTAEEQGRLAALEQDILAGRYLPDAVVEFIPVAAAEGGFPAFPALVGAHATQRVAAPGRELAPGALERLWTHAVESLPLAERGEVACAAFSWHDRTPARIGTAMFEALYGRGADPATRAGGEGGLLTRVTLGSWLATRPPGRLAGLLPTGWEGLPEEALRKAAADLAVREEDLGPHLRDRLLRDGKYHVHEGLLVDDRDRPLTAAVLVRLLKALAGTFGHFFLKFQNTHPANAVVMASRRGPSPHRTWRTVGRLAAALTFSARAEGLSSIVKTGPIDLACDAIHAILLENPDGAPTLAGLHAELAAGAWWPALTFQVGHPLADEVVDAGTPQAHGGLDERRRDRRPPRARFTDHVWAPLEDR